MGEVFPDEGKKLTRIGDRSKQVTKEQGNVEILELSNKVQCEHCHKYVFKTRLLQLWTFICKIPIQIPSL